MRSLGPSRDAAMPKLAVLMLPSTSGALPLFHISSSVVLSRKVSIGCQNPMKVRAESWSSPARFDVETVSHHIAVDIVERAGLEHEEAGVDPTAVAERLFAA